MNAESHHMPRNFAIGLVKLYFQLEDKEIRVTYLFRPRDVLVSHKSGDPY